MHNSRICTNCYKYEYLEVVLYLYELLEFIAGKWYNNPQGGETMKRRFRYIAIKYARMDGAFGRYLSMPISDRTRTTIIGERLSFLRQEAGLSQRDLCEIIGIAVTTYSGYEQGKHEPSAETVCRLAELYNISADFILGVGFNDPYDERIGEHYVECKGTDDLHMERLHDSMVQVAIEQHELEGDRAGLDDPDDDPDDLDESGL